MVPRHNDCDSYCLRPTSPPICISYLSLSIHSTGVYYPVVSVIWILSRLLSKVSSHGCGKWYVLGDSREDKWSKLNDWHEQSQSSTVTRSTVFHACCLFFSCPLYDPSLRSLSRDLGRLQVEFWQDSP